MLIKPTEDSGFAFVFVVKIRLTASAWASHLDGLIFELVFVDEGLGGYDTASSAILDHA